MSYLNQLNREQQEAVLTLEGPSLVLAGAGSGKTRVVTHRIVHMLEQGIPPSSILGVTFTNKAAEEMRERIRKLTQHHVLISTFHSLGARILRESIEVLGYQSNFAIYDEEDVNKLIKASLIELNIQDKKMDVKPFRQMISRAKNNLQRPNQIDRLELSTEVELAFPKVYQYYQSKLKEYNGVDFDDLLFLPAQLFEEHPLVLTHYQNRWRYILIDEYQDTNKAQYAIVNLLVAGHHNLFVVGDPDQSIYSWRGANIQNILNFERDYPGAKVIKLEQNYRSRTNILNAANALICRNDGRYKKNLWSDLGPGEKIKVYIAHDERDEANFVAAQIRKHQERDQISLKDTVVFYRTNAQSRAFEDSLSSKGISYTIIGAVSFYQRKEIKDVLAFLRMAISGADFIAFSRTINIPKRGIGEATVEKIREGANKEGMTILTYLHKSIQGQPFPNAIKLTTKQKSSLQEYLQTIHSLTQLARNNQNSIQDTVIAAIEKTGYLNHLRTDPETFEERKSNVDELIAKAIEWESQSKEPSLTSFLEELSLKANLDDDKKDQDRVNLMTIHNGKGLEFTLTFVVGLEEDLFPHVNSRDSKEAQEEERRLCYVGMTRAKEYLYLSHSQMRYLWGTLRYQRPSRFLKEIPAEYTEKFRLTNSERTPHKELEVSLIKSEKKLDQKNCTSPSINGELESFKAGDTVFHKDFGIGMVQESYQSSVGLTYKVFFSNDNSTKSLVAKFAKLSKIS